MHFGYPKLTVSFLGFVIRFMYYVYCVVTVKKKIKPNRNLWHGTFQCPWPEMVVGGVLVGFEDILSFGERAIY